MIPAWILTVLGIPMVAWLLVSTPMKTAMVRISSIAGAALMLVISITPWFLPGLRDWDILAVREGKWDGSFLRMDELSLVLPPLAALLWLFTVAVTPRMLLDRRGLGRVALATAFTTLGFLTENTWILLVVWAVSHVSLWRLCHPPGRTASHLAGAYILASLAFFAMGTVLVHLPGSAGPAGERWGVAFLFLAALIRKGIFPFHAWVPALFEHGPPGPATLFCAPQLGTYAVAIILVPHAPPGWLEVVAVLSLITAVHGAAMALVQSSARRACAYLFTSQSALVMAGLDCSSGEALAGALVLWVSSSLAFTGLASCVLVLEARRGRLDLRRYHGGYERKPMLAVSFLFMGLTCMGFPGTLGFIGEEMLLGGAVEEFPLLGFLVVLSGAFTGLAVLRMYFSLFCGLPGDGVRMELRTREALGFATIVSILVVAGLFPATMVESREEASRTLLSHSSRR